MAGNSSTFYLRREINDSNIKQWQNWSVDINYVVDQFNDIVQNFTERLDMAETTIDALNVKIQKISEQLESHDLRYVKLQYSSIEIGSSKNAVYTRSCGVYSYMYGQPNVVNVFSTKTIPGLYVNNTQVYAHHVETYSNPFLKISGSDAGTVINIKADNIAKMGEDIVLYFSVDPSLQDASIEHFDPDNNDLTKLTIKVKYSQVAQRQLITIDKSALAKTITEKVPMATDMITIDKFAKSVGKYSTIKTVANIASNKKLNN